MDFQYSAVAITGMCGSGKSSVADFLRKKGWSYLRFGQVTIDELNRRGMKINEQNERIVREELRARGTKAVFAERLWDTIACSLAYNNLVLDGMYSWSEYRLLKSRLGNTLIVIAVAAARETRYQRLAARTERPLSRSEAHDRDISEIENLDKGGPIAMADFTVSNDDTIAELHFHLEQLYPMLITRDPSSV